MPLQNTVTDKTEWFVASVKCKAALALRLSLPQESLSEKIQREKLTVSERLRQYGIYLGSWLLSTGLAFGCAASIYFLCQYEQQVGERSSWCAATKMLLDVLTVYKEIDKSKLHLC